MRLTLIPSDKFVSIDGEKLLKIEQDFSWIPENVHAVQWYDTWGEVEYNDGTHNLKIDELGIFEQAVTDHANEKQRILDEEAAREAARDYMEELRFIRNRRLSDCDWTQAADSPLSDTKKAEWATYRQELRDLTENVVDPKPLVLDPSHPEWPVAPAS